MPDDNLQTPAPVETPAPVASAPAQTPRETIISNYEQMYADPQTPTPAAVITPVTPEPAATAAPAASDLGAVLTALTAKITEMDQRLAEAQRAAITPAPQPTPGEQESWLKLLADGKQSEGEKALAAVLGPQIQQQAVQQALSLMQAEREINEFTAQVKAANPDLLPFEAYMTLGAQQRIAAGQAAGAVKSPVDYVTVYKAAVAAEIENARKMMLSFRGEGRQQAQTRVSEVLASPVLQPTPVNTNREQPVQTQSQEKTPDQIRQDYMAERVARQAKLAGMAV